MDINPEEEILYITQSGVALRKSVENENYARHWRMSIILPENGLGSNLFPSAMAPIFGQSCFDPSDCPAMVNIK